MENRTQGKETDWAHIEEILKRSEAGDIAPPRRGFLGLIHRCPQCNRRAKSRYFKEVLMIGGRIVIFYQFFECSICGWQYAKKARAPLLLSFFEPTIIYELEKGGKRKNCLLLGSFCFLLVVVGCYSVFYCYE